MKTFRLICFFLVCGLGGLFLFSLSCHPPQKTVSSFPRVAFQNDSTATSDECTYCNEVCKEAMEFQDDYEKMPRDQQKDMAGVMSSYVENCEIARKKCEESKIKK